MEINVLYGYRGRDVQDALDVEALVGYVLERQDVPEGTEVSVSFLDDDKVRRLNGEFRSIDRATDVLSFECDGFDDDFGAIAPDEEAPYELGDIMVAVDVAERQAPEYGLSLGEELSLLVTHGLLHLCGFDHMEDEEARVMEAEEERLLSGFWGRPFPRHGVEG